MTIGTSSLFDDAKQNQTTDCGDKSFRQLVDLSAVYLHENDVSKIVALMICILRCNEAAEPAQIRNLNRRVFELTVAPIRSITIHAAAEIL